MVGLVCIDSTHDQLPRALQMGEPLGVLGAEKVVLVSKLGGEVAVDFPCFKVGLKNGERDGGASKMRSGRMGGWADGGRE